MTRKKKTQQKKTQQKKNNYSISKELRACTVVLYDIAFETDLIQRYQLHLSLKRKKLLKQSASPINTSIHSTTNKQLQKKNEKKKATKNEKYTATTNCSKETVIKKRKEDSESQKNREDVKANKSISLSPQNDETTPSKFIAQRQQLIRHCNVKLFFSKNTDETSNTFTNTHFNNMQETILMDNKFNTNVTKSDIERKNRNSKRVQLNKPDVTYDADIKPVEVNSNVTNCLDKKNVSIIDYNSNMQQISCKSITDTQCNNNLYPVNFSDEINSKVKQEQYNKIQNSKDNIVQTRFNTRKSARNETKEPIVRQNVPKIIGNHVLPKGIKILKEAEVEILKTTYINNSFQSNISLKQGRCNNNDKNIDQISHIDDTAKTTNIILREKEYHTFPEINKSINSLKTSSPLNNNIDLKDKTFTNDKLYSNDIDCNDLNSLTKVRNNGHIDINDTNNETTITYENYTLNHEQLSKLTSNTEIHKNDGLQSNKKCEESSTKTILNKDTPDLMDIDDESYNISTPLISASKEGTIKQTLKRTLKEKNKDYELNSKKIKLNRNWLQNNVTSAKSKKSINHQQCNDTSSTVTTVTSIDTKVETNISNEYHVETNISNEYHEETNISNEYHEERSDLRKFLNNLRSGKNFKLKPTVEKNEEVCKKLCAKRDSTLNETSHEKKNYQEEDTNVVTDNEDDDCISLFAESFTEFNTSQCEDIFLREKDKSCKSLHSDVPYTMTASSFDKYVKQNNKEFNKEYAECIENNTKILELNKANKVSNNQSAQPTQSTSMTMIKHQSALNTENISATVIEPKLLQIRNIYPQTKTLYDFIRRYCFQALRCGICHKYQCMYKHDLRNIFYTVNSEDPKIILDILPEALKQNFNHFCEEVYIALLKKLTIDQILKTYRMFHDRWDFNLRNDFTISARKNIAHNIIKELLNRKMSLKIIIDHMVTYIWPTNNFKELYNILSSVDMYVKPGEYWNTVRNLILKLGSNVSKSIVDKILHECIKSKELENIQDINNNLINKLDSTLISTLDKYAMKCFQNMLINDSKYVEKTAKNSEVLIQNFGENLTIIASPDSPDPSQNTSFTQQSPTRYDVTFISEADANQSENCITQDIDLDSTKPYMCGFMQPIDAPYARSIYRDHERFWKFYMDLERFEKGLIYEDYDYVIDILKNYTKKRESELFVSKCCLILRKVKRSEYHLKNILRLTGNQYFNKNTLIERGFIK